MLFRSFVDFHCFFIYFQDSFTSNLLRIIQQMRPKDPSNETDDDFKENSKSEAERKREKFPCLALPNDDNARVSI